MEIYLVRNPYAAIIVAKDFDQLISKYEEDVCDLDDLDAFKDTTYTISREVCADELAEAMDETSVNVIGIEKAKQIVNDALDSDKPTLLVIDSDLI